MNVIRVRKQIDSETLHLAQLRELIGKTVEILILEEVAAPAPEATAVDCFEAIPPQGSFDPKELEAMRPMLTPEQYEAFWYLARPEGIDVDAIAQLRAASVL